MCGISGIWGTDLGQADAEAAVRRMLETLRHRGPDGQGTLSYDGGAAGMVRLALVDLSERGQQPIWSPDGKVAILFNGEMYNHAQERTRLAAGGYPFRSHTDTEVILALYLERGLEFVHAVRGMFAIALFDFRDEPKLILARDPFGIKPLLYAHPIGCPNGVVFASELRPLLTTGLVSPYVDRQALSDYLSFGFVLQPRTMVMNVRQLEPGTIAVYARGQPPQTTRYFTMPAATNACVPYEEATRHLRMLLSESVRLHALADTPVGVFLSGGIDSSAMAALMIQHNAKLRSYTLKMEHGDDESNQAEAFAKKLGCNHTNIEVSDREVRDLIPLFAQALDRPSNDGFNSWLISRGAARDVKGVISGLGGDEWFAGYRVARRMNALEKRRNIWVRPLAQLAQLAQPWSPGHSLKQRAHNLATRRSPISTWAAAHCVFRPDEIATMTGLLAPNTEAALQAHIAPHSSAQNAVDLACELDVYGYMGCQLLRDSDVTSMASSLELRVPLVDVKIAQFARGCPPHYKLDDINRSRGKRIFVDAVSDLLPPDIYQRPKRGFSLPYETWLNGPLKELVNDLWQSSRLIKYGLCEQLPASPDDVPPWPQRWTLMVLELWLRNIVDKPWH